MNERIEELSIQCGAWHQVYDHKRLMVDRHFDVEKFAELIVREAHEVIVVGGVDDVDNVLKHFGVEE